MLGSQTPKFAWMSGFVILVGLGSSQAAADDFHYENFRFGQEALGMAGAMTGVPALAEGAFYNPGGLGFIEVPELSAAFNFYGSDTRVLEGGLNATIQYCCENEGDLVSNEFLPVPSSSVFTFPIGKHVLGFSTFIVSDTNENFVSDFGFKQAREDYNLLTGRKIEDQIIYVGPSYAYRLNDSFSVGASAFLASRNQETTSTYGASYVSSLQAINGISINTSTDVVVSDFAVLAKLGAMYKLTPDFVVGASMATQSINITGSGNTFLSSTTQIPDEERSDKAFAKLEDISAETVYPWQFAFGASYNMPDTLRLVAEVSVHLGTEYQRLEDSGNIEIDGESYTHNQYMQLLQYNNDISRETVINYKVGVETTAIPSATIRAGAYTNFSAAPDIPTGALQGRAPSQVDLIGVTGSIGYKGSETAITGGINYEFGEGYDTVAADSNEPFDEFTRVDRFEQRLIFFLAGDLEFVDDIKQSVRDAKDLGNTLKTFTDDPAGQLKEGLTPNFNATPEPTPTPAPVPAPVPTPNVNDQSPGTNPSPTPSPTTAVSPKIAPAGSVASSNAMALPMAAASDDEGEDGLSITLQQTRFQGRGKFDENAIKGVFEANDSELKSCYTQANNAGTLKQTSGSVNIVMGFGTGRGLYSIRTSGELGSPQLNACLDATVKGWDFPAPVGGPALVGQELDFSGETTRGDNLP